MKLFIVDKLLIFVILWSGIGFSGSFGVRGGGDVYAEEFHSFVRSEILYLKLSPSAAVLNFYHQYYKQLDKITVRFTGDNLFLDNTPVQAINDRATKLVLVSVVSWKKLSFYEKKVLAFHEFVSVLGFDDSNYQLSQMIIDEIERIKSSSLVLWRNKMELPLKAIVAAPFYFSKDGVFATDLLISKTPYCYLHGKNRPEGIYKLYNFQFQKSIFISKDLAYQNNEISFSMQSQNKTHSIDVICKYQSETVGMSNPNEINLQNFIDSLKPLLDPIAF